MKLFPNKPTKRSAPARRTLEAAVARRAARSPMIEEEEEPTTSFKTALVVVLLLHLVAGGGIIMFDQIKTRRLSGVETAAPAKKAMSVAAQPKPTAAPVVAPVEAVKKNAPAVPVAAAAPAVHSAPVVEVKDSGKTYTVVQGDKLAAIAKKLHVGYDDLLKINKIDDPKKLLRVGQKLHIPVKPRAAAN
ncbi:MAG: LysM peptidoglycan-binding domain-containing protein [Verrucomicrobiota bacterium]